MQKGCFKCIYVNTDGQYVQSGQEQHCSHSMQVKKKSETKRQRSWVHGIAEHIHLNGQSLYIH